MSFKKFLFPCLIVLLIPGFFLASCTQEERIRKPIALHFEEDFLDISSSADIYSLYTLSESDVINICRAIKRFGIHKEGGILYYVARSPEDINVSPKLYTLIVNLLENNKSPLTRSSSPNDCVAYALSWWGDYDYDTINNYITGLYGDDGVPEYAIFGVIQHFYPNARQHSPDSIDANFVVSATTTIGYFQTGAPDNAHMVNIDSIDSVGVVTYVDIQGGSIGYNSVSDYSYFYTKN